MSASVLIADDDASILRALRFLMQREGHDVRTAADGEEALKLAVERQPNLAVLDVRMPKLDGFEVTRRIRVEDSVREMPVILLTASTEPSDMRAGYEAGADDYLRKPFSAPDELITSVYSQLERS
jgi:DNA-binding response OmpR family regulator